jgi:hypothetical protein
MAGTSASMQGRPAKGHDGPVPRMAQFWEHFAFRTSTERFSALFGAVFRRSGLRMVLPVLI